MKKSEAKDIKTGIWLLLAMLMILFLFTIYINAKVDTARENARILDQRTDDLGILESRVKDLEDSAILCDSHSHSHSYYYVSHTAHVNASKVLDIPDNDTYLADALADGNPYDGIDLFDACLDFEKDGLACDIDIHDGRLEMRVEDDEQMLFRIEFENECIWRLGISDLSLDGERG